MSSLSKILYIIIPLLLIGGVAAGFGYVYYKTSSQAPEPVICTQDAKLCPDGSYVARTGPHCEFAQCPEVKGYGTIEGKITVGPICPVERPGVPCPASPEAYTSREAILYAKDGVTIIKQMHFTPSGTYSFSIPAGTYIIDIPHQGVGGSKEVPHAITIKENETQEFNFSIDTGIR